jgi:hypothetical protein
MSFGKNRSNSRSNQSFNQTSSTSYNPAFQARLDGQFGRLQGQSYRALSPTDYQQYESPYQQEVIDATTADINANRAQAANGQRASIAGAGAFGDKRRGIMEAELDGQYDRTLATTVAGLRQAGYSQAQGIALGENNNRNQFDANTQNQIAQLMALLAQGNQTTTGSGSSAGRTSGSSTNFGFSWNPTTGFGGSGS